jgi:nucleoside-specific channel-forming protein
MKKTITLILITLPLIASAADYSDGNRRKNDNTWLALNLFHAQNLANPVGDEYDNTYLEVEGGGRSGVLDFYFFADINNLLATGDHDDHPGEFFVKVQPRLSIDSTFDTDLSIGPVKEWYLATMFKGGNGFERYYAGVGTDLKIPGFDVLSLNLYSMAIHENSNHLDYGGIVIAPNWYTVLHNFSDTTFLTYQGWAEYGFGNAYDSDKENGTHTEFQMFNGFYCYFMQHYALSFSIKFHRHLGYLDAESADATSYFFGAHYHF